MTDTVSLFFTGTSGYIGATILENLEKQHDLKQQLKVYANVRNEEQAAFAESAGYHAAWIDNSDKAAMKEFFLSNKVRIVVHTGNSFDWHVVEGMIEALAKVKIVNGVDVHFITTSGAKILSMFNNFDSSRQTSDLGTETIDYARTKLTTSPDALPGKGLKVNIDTLDLCDKLGVKSYIVFPPIVFGIRKGFGNRISIQEVAIVRAGRRLGRVMRVAEKGDRWAICHVEDVAELYLSIVKGILQSDQDAFKREPPPWGIKGGGGFYIAETGTVEWEALYTVAAQVLYQRGLASSPEVHDLNTEEDKVSLAKALDLGANYNAVKVAMGGNSPNLHGDNGRKNVGWNPKYNEEFYLKSFAEEVAFILDNDPQK